LPGIITAVAIGDDVERVATMGRAFVAAKVFLPEAAGRCGVELINIEDVITSLINLMTGLMENRRVDMLIKIMETLLPHGLPRSYSYWDVVDERGRVGSNHLEVKVTVPNRPQQAILDGLSVIFNSMAMEFNKYGNTEARYTIGKEYRGYTVSLDISHDLRGSRLERTRTTLRMDPASL
jgi:hypothetical protein